MEIISLLQSLYTQFDVLCGDLDIYKVITRAGGFAFSQSALLSSACHHAINDPILSFCLSCLSQVETIGDAYCAAGGLHRASSTHAQQIAWMALCMLEVCRYHQTHDGQPIQVSWFFLSCTLLPLPVLYLLRFIMGRKCVFLFCIDRQRSIATMTRLTIR